MNHRKVLRAKFIFPVSAPSIRNGAIIVRDNRIEAVGAWQDIRKSITYSEIFDLGDSVILPAAINAHTHLELTSLGHTIPENTPFVDWILSLVKARKTLSPKDLVVSAEQGINMVKSFVTAAVGDIATIDSIVEKLAQDTLSGVVYYELLGIDPEKAPSILKNAQQKLTLWQKCFKDTKLRFGLSLHTPFTTSPELLRSTARWCQSNNVPLSIHVAESLDETQFLFDGSGAIPDKLYQMAGWPRQPFTIPGCSPITYLHKLKVLDARPLLIHGVQATMDDIKLLQRKHIAVVHCPRSNMRLMNGRFRLAEFLESGIKVCLGTDSLASCPSLSIWEEMQAAWDMHNKVGENISPQNYLACATLHGAQALSVDKMYGSIEVGKAALFGVASLENCSHYESNDSDQILTLLMTGASQIANLPVLLS
ncbi:TPA: amidohydrolase family protein [Legionella pneumophila]|nr:amidohydrolase family protein [Legionella pneumophila]HAT8183623.1 amidohydrolase family protein [Legionella pneumophila]